MDDIIETIWWNVTLMLCKNKVFYSHSDHFYKWTFQNSSLGEEASWKTDSIYEKCVIEIEKLKNRFGN